MAQIGLLFGSFNPVHIGHLALANYMLSTQGLNEIWFVVSPQNPFKEEHQLADSRHRLKMVEIAVHGSPNYNACDIELHLPKPSYTADTLQKLREGYPQHAFSLLMGSDNLMSIERWKNFREILDNHRLLIYPRPGYNLPDILFPNILVTQAPLMELSSTFIRDLLGKGADVRYFVPNGVANYIKTCGLYETNSQ